MSLNGTTVCLSIYIAWLLITKIFNVTNSKIKLQCQSLHMPSHHSTNIDSVIRMPSYIFKKRLLSSLKLDLLSYNGCVSMHEQKKLKCLEYLLRENEFLTLDWQFRTLAGQKRSEQIIINNHLCHFLSNKRLKVLV